MTRIYLVRHGETIWNKTHRFQGFSDVKLTEKGIEQAKKLSNSLSNIKFDIAFSSDLSRSFDTCRYILNNNQEIFREKDLKEVNFGEWEGLTRAGIDSEELQQFFNYPLDFAAPDGESFFDVQKRAFNCFTNIVEKNEGKNILIVSHGGVIRTLIAELLKIDLRLSWNIRQDNTAVNIIARYSYDTLLTRADDYIIETINNTNHLNG